MRKVKMTLVLAVVASFGASSVLAAQAPAAPNASQVCKSLRTQMGVAAFRSVYGTNHNKKNAFGKCVSAQTKLIHKHVNAAKKACKAEQAADPAAFTAKYGTNHNKKNAYGKCVSARATATVSASNAALLNAAKQCKAERKADPAAFKAKYGTNHNKRNAFGKCVSRAVKATA
jgi:hypothetical protein